MLASASDRLRLLLQVSDDIIKRISQRFVEMCFLTFRFLLLCHLTCWKRKVEIWARVKTGVISVIGHQCCCIGVKKVDLSVI